MSLVPVTVPKWGLAMEEGRVTAWLVPEGARVAAGQEIAEVETSKIANAIEAPRDGVLRRVVATPDTVVPVGGLLAVIADTDAPDAEIDAFIAGFTPADTTESGTAPPAPATIEADGRKFRVLQTGPRDAEKLPVVLLHGFYGDLDSWMFLRDRLPSDRAVVSLDLPGHGGSSKEVGDGTLRSLAAAVLAVLDALAVPRAHLVGHSLGGAVAFVLARDQPDRVASVTAIAAAGLGQPADRGFIDGMLASRRARDFRPFAEMLFADPARVTRDLLEDLAKVKRIDGVQAALETIARATLFASETDHVARGVTLPIHAIVAERDRVIPPPADPPAGALRLPVGHMAHMEAPAEVARAIADFLAARP